MDGNVIGVKLKKRRNELGWTLKELSLRCGILPQLISDYENGRKDPGVKNIKLLCKAMNLNVNYLLSDETNQHDNGKTNTYGNVLQMYLSALELSKKDELIIDKDKRIVEIHINDEVLKNVLIQSKDFIEMGGDVAYTIKNFNINILSNIEIE